MMTVLLSLHYVKDYSYAFRLTVPYYGLGRHDTGWWFPVMASAFLIFTIVIMFIAGTGQYGLGKKVL